MNADINRLRTGELVAGIGGVALILIMFIFDWYGAGGALQDAAAAANVEFGGANAWEAFEFTDVLLFVAALTGIGLAVIALTQQAPTLPVAASVITTGVAGFVSVWMLWRIINQPGPNNLIDVKIGAYLGFVAVLAIAVGGWLAMRDEGATFPGREQFGQARPAPPPSPGPPPPATREPAPGEPSTPAGPGERPAATSPPPAGPTEPAPPRQHEPPAPGPSESAPPPPPAEPPAPARSEPPRSTPTESAPPPLPAEPPRSAPAESAPPPLPAEPPRSTPTESAPPPPRPPEPPAPSTPAESAPPPPRPPAPGPSEPPTSDPVPPRTGAPEFDRPPEPAPSERPRQDDLFGEPPPRDT